MPKPYKLFTIYAREDVQYLEELRGQLRPLEIAGLVKVWSDREINPGVDWEREIVHNLDTADIILILVSSAYYNSVFIHEKEIKYALSRHEKGETKILPIIVRPCSFGDDPVISRLQVLPTDGKPVTSQHWRERDDAWLDVVAGVKRTISIIHDAENRSEQEIREAAERERLAAEQKKEEENRTREEQARFEREAKQRAENEWLAAEAQKAKEATAQLRREQEQEAHRAEQAAWQQAAGRQDIPAYEYYLTQYPQGEYAREARAKIKESKRQNVVPLPWGRYSSIAGLIAILFIGIWWGITQLTDRPEVANSGLELYLSNGKYGYRDRSGKEIIAAKYEAAKPFQDGRAEVILDGQTFTIDATGTCVADCPEEKEKTAWAEAERLNNIEAYKIYQQNFPKGRFYTEASERIKVFEAQIQKGKNAFLDQQAWDKAIKTDNITAYERYQKFYPSGQYYQQAQKRIDALKIQQQKAGETRDYQAWREAISKNTISAYRSYQTAYPQGKYYADAGKKIQELQKAANDKPPSRTDTRTLWGKITEANGEPLIGATISIKGTNSGAVSDVNGNFKINVPQNSTTLVVSYVGYKTKTVQIGGSNVYNVVLNY
jgi:CarboxypepD_reg-like domain/TIR domain/WG containing repeat